MPHVHVSAVDALIVFAMVALIGLAWRLTAARLVAKGGEGGSGLGEAMAVIY
jgi:hypothetical protein